MALYLGNQRVSPNMITTVSGTKNITDTSLTDVSLYQYAQVSDGNLVAGNIKKGVSILGITGTLEGTTPVSGTLKITSNGTFDVSDKQYAEVNVAAKLTNPKTVTPKATSQTILPNQGDDGLSQVTVSGDSNLVAGNIKKDVSIFGVTGTLESGSGGSGGSSKLINLIERDKSFSLTADNLAGITKIGNSAFYDCKELTSITIPDSVTSIGKFAFYGCTGLTSFTIPDSVTSIGGKAFMNCNGFTSIVIPEKITSIGESIFYGCRGLTSVTIPDSVTRIGVEAFAYCKKLTSITIPSGVTTIDSFAFRECGLTSITIPDKVTNISQSTFSGCTALTSVKIGNGVQKISNYAFYGCRGLMSITIPDSVTRIETSAFSICSSLANIIIGSGVTTIESSVFAQSTNIKSIECHNTTPPSISSSTFDSSIASNEGFVITVPAGSGDAYKAATGWSQFADKIVESTEF